MKQGMAATHLEDSMMSRGVMDEVGRLNHV